MEKTAALIRFVIVMLCVILFMAGALWNLCVPAEEFEETADVIAGQAEAVDGLRLQPQDGSTDADDFAAKQKALENRIASLRIKRDAAWEQLYQALGQLETAEQQQMQTQYAELQYHEQKLELLLSAKGIAPSLAVLGINQANIIVSDEVLQKEAEKLYDLVLRNTNYEESQIIFVPLK